MVQISLNTGLQRRNPTKPITNAFKGKKTSCPAGAFVNNENDKIISFLGEHSHDSELLEKRVREIEKQVVKESSKYSNKSTNCSWKHLQQRVAKI